MSRALTSDHLVALGLRPVDEDLEPLDGTAIAADLVALASGHLPPLEVRRPRRNGFGVRIDGAWPVATLATSGFVRWLVREGLSSRSSSVDLERGAITALRTILARLEGPERIPAEYAVEAAEVANAAQEAGWSAQDDAVGRALAVMSDYVWNGVWAWGAAEEPVRPWVEALRLTLADLNASRRAAAALVSALRVWLPEPVPEEVTVGGPIVGEAVAWLRSVFQPGSRVSIADLRERYVAAGSPGCLSRNGSDSSSLVGALLAADAVRRVTVRGVRLVEVLAVKPVANSSHET